MCGALPLNSIRMAWIACYLDWAIEVARLLDGRYRRAKKVILACDNLNTHTKAARL